MSDTTSESESSMLDQIVVSRDGDGLIVPEEVYIEEFDDTVLARPMNNAAQDKYLKPFIQALQAANAIHEQDVDIDELTDEEREQLEDLGRNALSDQMLAEMFDEHIVEPDLLGAYQANHPDEEITELDARFVEEDLLVGAQDGLLFAVLLASDMDELVDALRGVVEEDADADDEGEDDEGN